MALWESVVVVIVLSFMLLALFFELAPAYIVMLTALVAVWDMGIIDTDQALSGFSNSSMIMVASLFVIAQGVEKSHLIERMALKLFGNSGQLVALLKLLFLTFGFSAIFNNTPIVFILIPITRDWARSKGIAPSQFLIPLSFASIFGGCLTIIGTSTNLVINGLLIENGKEPFAFIEPGYLGLPLGIMALGYLALLGPILLPKDKGGLFREIRE
jgi:di/tricarboxylate transporter